MKQEKEVFWIINLLDSRFIKKVFGSIGACKNEFEKTARASESNKEFRKWFNELIEEESVELFGEKSIGISGNLTNIYVINKSKLFKRLREIEFYNSLKGIVIKNETSLGI